MTNRTRKKKIGLYARLCTDAVLWSAWGKIAAGSKMPGVDGISLAKFSEGVENHVRSIQLELRSGTFRFSPLRDFDRKAADRSRIFSMPRVRDRLVHRALLDVIGGSINRSCSDSSFAYRKGRSWTGALKRVEDARNRGECWVYRADIHSFFDSIDHEVLRQQLSNLFTDRRIAGLMMSAVAAPSVSSTGFADRTVGIPLGLSISGALANLYLNPLDMAMGELPGTYVRYADDFVVLSTSPETIEQARATGENALRELGLRTQPKKSYVSTFDRGFGYLGWVFFGEGGFQQNPSDWVHPLEFQR